MPDENLVVGQIIARNAPAGWRKAWISARADDGYVGELTADYVGADGQETWFDIPDAAENLALANALLALRDNMPGEEKWSTCTFTLSPDGTFKLDVGYGD